MSSLTLTQGRDDILKFLKAAWDSGAGGAPLLYQGKDGVPPESGSWGRAVVKHSERKQATLAGETGIRRWEQKGFLFVQLFHIAGSGAFTALDSLAQMLINAFQGKRTIGGVWFRNAQAKEVGKDDKWESFNFMVEFEYDQLA